MADRYVRIDIFSKGADDVKKDFDDLKKDADELTDKPHEVEVSANTDDAKERMDALKLKLDILTKEAHDIPITLGNDKFNVQILEERAKLDELKEKAGDMKLGLSTDKFHAEVLKAGLELDNLKRKADELKIGEDKGFLKGLVGGIGERLFGRGGEGGGGGGLSGLFGAGGSAGSEGGGSIGKDALSSLGGASNWLTGGAIGGAIAAAMSISPAVIPFALGGGAGIGGILAAYLTGHTKGIMGLESTGKSTLDWALSSNAPRPHGGTAPGTSFLAGLSPIYHQLDGFIKSVGPELAEMFRASLPFITAFAKIMEQLAKLLMPAMTESMKELTPYLPQITQGFAFLSEGVADFIKDMGPGMKDSVTVFKAMMDAVKGILIGLAFACDGLAIAFAHVGDWVRNTVTDIHNRWDELRHDTANIFDGIRHDIATIWDDIFAHTIGTLMDADHRMLDIERGWGHDVASVFDDLRHGVASIWDGMWSDLMDRLRSGENSAMDDLRSWWHTIDSNFDNLRHSVASTWDSMWDGLKNSTQDAIHSISDILHGIENAFESPFKWVVQHAFEPLASVWDDFAKHVGLPQIHVDVGGFATGGKINAGTGPKSDDVLIRASKGETVVSAAHSAMLAPIFNAVGVPGYSGGGLLGGIGSIVGDIGKGILSLIPGGSTLVKDIEKGAVSAALKGFEAGTASALGTSGPAGMFRDALDTVAGAAIKALSGAYSKTESAAGKYGNAPPGSGPYQAYARKLFPRFGWGPGQFTPFNAIVMQESGWNPNAQNPTSSAYGIGQFLNSTWATVGGHKTSNPYLQIFYMEEYIKQRYGDPSTAEAYHLAHNSYGFGGVINEPVFGLGLHTGQSYQFGELGPETVTPGRHAAGGGDVYNIMVAGDTNPDAAALRIIQEIRRYKKKHGNQATGIG